MYYIYVMVMRSSSVSFSDYAKLVATYNVKTDNNLMDQKLLERGYTPAQIDALYKNNNKSHKSLNLVLRPGFETLSFPNFDFYYSLFSKYEKGILPFSGCLTDQPNKIIEIFSILESLNLEYEKRQRDEHAREMKKSRK